MWAVAVNISDSTSIVSLKYRSRCLLNPVYCSKMSRVASSKSNFWYYAKNLTLPPRAH